MKTAVSIYQFIDELEESEHPYANLQFELAFLAVVTVDAAPGDTDQRVCARAWVECVGQARRERLTELGFGGLAWIEVHVDSIANGLVLAPAGLPKFGFLHDNCSETWLLSPSWDESPRDTPRLVRSRHGGRPAFPALFPRGAEAVVRSIAHPKRN